MAGLNELPTLDASLGAFFIGTIIAAALWGLGVSQCFKYYTTYTTDPLSVKILVLLVLLLDTAHQAVICQILYYFLIQNFFNPAALAEHIPTLQTVALLATFTYAVVNSFFTYRIWSLSKHNYYYITLPILFILAALAVTLAYFIMSFRIADTESTGGRHPVAASINGLCAGGDIAVAVTMSALLYSKKTGFKQSDSTITKLMTYTVQTGLITSVAAIITLIVALAMPGITYSCFYHITAKLYVNTMLGVLNARKRLTGVNTPNTTLNSRNAGSRLSGAHFGNTTKNEGTDRENILASIPATETSVPETSRQTDSMTEKHIQPTEVV